MPTFPSNPTITSRLSTGSALTYTQMDTNFGNLTASIDSVINVIKEAAYTGSSNVYMSGTSQSFWSLLQEMLLDLYSELLLGLLKLVQLRM